jgi:hypothetical protein
LILRREKSTWTSIEVIQVVSIKSQVLFEPSASTLCKFGVLWREHTFVKVEASAAHGLIVSSIRLINLIVDPIITCESVLVILGSFALARINQRAIEDDAAEAISDLERADVGNLHAEILSGADLISIPCAGVLDLVPAIVFRRDAASEHGDLEVINLDFGDDTINIMHREGSNS